MSEHESSLARHEGLDLENESLTFKGVSTAGGSIKACSCSSSAHLMVQEVSFLFVCTAASEHFWFDKTGFSAVHDPSLVVAALERVLA